MNDLNIITPTLNEEKNIKKLITILNQLYPKASITVVDDGSSDKTLEIVRKENKAKLIDRSEKKVKGLTTSVIDGILSTNQKYFIVIDSDMQHPPEKIKEIYNKLKSNSIVIAERNKVLCDWPFHRKLISKTAIALGNMRLIICGKYYHDIVSGFFGGETGFVKKIISQNKGKFELEGYKILFDILKYIPRNTKIGYVKYNFGLRDMGSSKMGKKQFVSYLRSLLK